MNHGFSSSGTMSGGGSTAKLNTAIRRLILLEMCQKRWNAEKLLPCIVMMLRMFKLVMAMTAQVTGIAGACRRLKVNFGIRLRVSDVMEVVSAA